MSHQLLFMSFPTHWCFFPLALPFIFHPNECKQRSNLCGICCFHIARIMRYVIMHAKHGQATEENAMFIVFTWVRHASARGCIQFSHGIKIVRFEAKMPCSATTI